MIRAFFTYALEEFSTYLFFLYYFVTSYFILHTLCFIFYEMIVFTPFYQQNEGCLDFQKRKKQRVDFNHLRFSKGGTACRCFIAFLYKGSS